MALCHEITGDSHALADLCHRELGSTPEAIKLSRGIANRLDELKVCIRSALVNHVVEDFMDGMKQFTECVLNGTKLYGTSEKRDATVRRKGRKAVQLFYEGCQHG